MTSSAVFGLCFGISFIVSLITGIIVKIKTEDKITDEYRAKLNQYKSYDDRIKDDEDFPYLLSCPSCKNVKITLRSSTYVPNVYISNGRIEFSALDITTKYKIICPQCGMQTKDFKHASEAIINWNGRSESTEIVKKEE